MKVYKLDPAIWDRGRGGAHGTTRGQPVKLDGPSGRCCLGFVALEEGIPITNEDSPQECGKRDVGLAKWRALGLLLTQASMFAHTSLATDLISINDDPDILTDIERVARLNAALEAEGADWRFELA